MTDDDPLAELSADLVKGRPRSLGPADGYEAFQHHKLLAAAVHRAAKLDQTDSESDTDAWVRFLTTHYPDGRNGEPEARLLFGDWRSSLLKGNTPGPGVALTHGQSRIHWQRDEHGSLGLNLEDAWDDFHSAVDSFVASLGSSPRRAVVLDRWQKQQWVVRPFASNIDAHAGATVMDVPASASFTRTETRFNVTPAQSVTASRRPEMPKPKQEPEPP